MREFDFCDQLLVVFSIGILYPSGEAHWLLLSGYRQVAGLLFDLLLGPRKQLLDKFSLDR